MRWGQFMSPLVSSGSLTSMIHQQEQHPLALPSHRACVPFGSARVGWLHSKEHPELSELCQNCLAYSKALPEPVAEFASISLHCTFMNIYIYLRRVCLKGVFPTHPGTRQEVENMCLFPDIRLKTCRTCVHQLQAPLIPTNPAMDASSRRARC